MLKQLRHKKTAKKIWITLAIIIVPAFVFWGLGGALRSRQEKAFAGKIFGRNIPLLDFKDAMEAVKNQAIMQFGDNFTEIQKYLNLENQAWERLILLAEAERRKIKASDREVIELIEKYPFFQRKGQFDNQNYSQMLQYVFRTQPRAFEEETRQNIALSRLYKEVTDGLKLNDEEIKAEYHKANEEISIYYIASSPVDFQNDLKPGPEELQDYFTKNSFEFKQPLSFNVEYLAADSEDKIKKAFSRLNKKSELAKLTKELGVEAKETGLFKQTDPIPGIGWAPEVMNIISKLKAGQFSSPIQMDKYYYILRLKERKEPYIPDFETIKDTIKAEVIKKQAGKIAKERIENCLKKLKADYAANPKSVDFNRAAKEYGLKSDGTGNFKFGSYIEGIGASDNFWTQAQTLKEGEVSGIIETAPGFYIIKVKSKTPIDEKKFAAEKKDFAERLLLQKQQEYFAQFIEALKRKARLY